MLTSITRSILFILLFSLGLMYGLMAFLPLQLVANEIQKNVPGITIGEATGHWWQGRFDNVNWQQFNHATVSWKLNLTALLGGQIEADIDIAHKVINAFTKVTLPMSDLMTAGKVNITGAQANIEIAQLTPYAPYPLPNITGQLTVFIEQLVLNLDTLSSASSKIPILILDSPIRFSTSKVTVLDDLTIGKYNGEITNINNNLGYKITVQSTSSDINVSGHSMLSSHEIRSQYLVEPDQNTDPQLTKLLDMMGQKLQNGHYRFNTAYAL